MANYRRKTANSPNLENRVFATALAKPAFSGCVAVLPAQKPTETGDTQFEWKYFIEQNNSELLAKLGNFVNRGSSWSIPRFTSRPCQTTPNGVVGSVCQVPCRINELLGAYVDEMEAVSLRAGLVAAMAIAQAGNNFLQSQGFDNSSPQRSGRAAAVTGHALN